MKNKCFVCGLDFENGADHFDKFGNVCTPCNIFLERIWQCKKTRDKGREDFWRGCFSRFIISRSINS